jgi:hypothetical protein
MNTLTIYPYLCYIGLLLMLQVTISLGQDESNSVVGSRVPDQLIADTKPKNYKTDLQFEAANWTSWYVSPSYLPPKNSRYVVLSRKNEKEWDKLQLSYQVENSLISIVQSHYFFSLQIESTNWPDEGALGIKTIEKTARDIFVDAASLELNATNALEGHAKSGDFVKAPWLKSLCWKKNGRTLIFMWLKISRTPSSIYIPASSLRHSYWFSDPPK